MMFWLYAAAGNYSNSTLFVDFLGNLPGINGTYFNSTVEKNGTSTVAQQIKETRSRQSPAKKGHQQMPSAVAQGSSHKVSKDADSVHSGPDNEDIIVAALVKLLGTATASMLKNVINSDTGRRYPIMELWLSPVLHE